MNKNILNNQNLFLSFLPISLLGSLANTSNISTDSTVKVVNPITQQTGISPGPRITYNRYNAADNSQPINYHYSQDQDYYYQQKQLTDGYEQSLKDPNPRFSFPERKYYEFQPHKYTVKGVKGYCYYINKDSNNVCPSEKSSYVDQLITVRNHVIINSLKGYDLSEYKMIKQRPGNLNYDDWTTRSIEKSEKHKVNWKEQHGYFRKNVFEDTFLHFNVQDKKPFSSERYSLHFDRWQQHTSFIPIFTGFHRGRSENARVLGFESFKEMNVDFDQMLKDNDNAKSIDAQFLKENANIDWKRYTREYYGWYNPNWWGKYSSYYDAYEKVERMTTDVEHNFGSPYISWKGEDNDDTAVLYTPVPFTDNYWPYEMKPISVDENNRKLSDWNGHDLFHINYDHVLMFHQPLLTHEHLVYPFSLNLNKIKEVSPDVNEFFKISDNFDFFLNYTYKNEDLTSRSYSIQDLIGKNALIFDFDPLGSNTKIDKLYLTIKPKDHNRVKLLLADKSEHWHFDIYADQSDHYSLNNKSLSSINVSEVTNVDVNDDFVTTIPPSLFKNPEIQKLAFTTRNSTNSFPVSLNILKDVLKVNIKQADDYSGILEFEYYDPFKDMTFNRVFQNMPKRALT